MTTCGIIGAGNPTPTDPQASQAFQCLIALVDTSNADPLRQLTETRNSFALVPGQQAYMIGPDPSLDIPQPRPAKILRANVVDMNAQPNPFHIPMRVLEWDQYNAWGVRNSPTPLPLALWYDRGYNAIPNPTNPSPPPENVPDAGYGTINIVGMPTAPNPVEVWFRAPLTQASTYFDELVFPPGYYEYLLYGTCIRLYPKFTRKPDPTVLQLYKDARLAVESANASPMPVMPLDSGLPNSRGAWWDGRTNSWIVR